MRTHCLLFGILLLAQQAGAQVRAGRYAIWTIGSGTFFTPSSARDVTAGFPFTIDQSATNQTFSGRLGKSFLSSPIFMFNLSNFELVGRRHRHSIDLGFGYFHENGGEHGWYIQSGYRRIFPLGAFLLKPGVDCYLIMSTKTPLGSIDNKGREIHVQGHTAYPEYTKDYTDEDGYTTTTTYDASRLDIDYQRIGLIAEPKIVLSVKPVGRYTISLETGWMIQLSQESKLIFVQTDGSFSSQNSIGQIPIDHNGLFGGPYMALNLGLTW